MKRIRVFEVVCGFGVESQCEGGVSTINWSNIVDNYNARLQNWIEFHPQDVLVVYAGEDPRQMRMARLHLSAVKTLAPSDEQLDRLLQLQKLRELK
ncbi:MAG: hypothetical protein AAB830_02160 [Patescibacteria group bacterium]